MKRLDSLSYPIGRLLSFQYLLPDLLNNFSSRRCLLSIYCEQVFSEAIGGRQEAWTNPNPQPQPKELETQFRLSRIIQISRMAETSLKCQYILESNTRLCKLFL